MPSFDNIVESILNKDILKPEEEDNKENEVTNDEDSLIEPLNYTDPFIVHDAELSHSYLAKVWEPVNAHEGHYDEETGETDFGAYETRDITKVYGKMEPVVQLSNNVIDKNSINYLCLMSVGITPTIELDFDDRENTLRDKDAIGMNSNVIVAILPRFDSKYKAISMMFDIVSVNPYEDDPQRYHVVAEYHLPEFMNNAQKVGAMTFSGCDECQREPQTKTTTWEYFHEIAKQCKLGFACTDKCKDVMDNEIRRMNSITYKDFISRELTRGGLDDNSIFDGWIDFYHTLTLVNMSYVLHSDITYRHLSIWAENGFHGTDVNTPSIKLDHVHRVLTNFDKDGTQSNLKFSEYQKHNEYGLVKEGGHNRLLFVNKAGTTPVVTMLNVEAQENSVDGTHKDEYYVSTIINCGFDTSINGSLGQRHIRDAFLSKYKAFTLEVVLDATNLGFQRGTLVEGRTFEFNPVAKQKSLSGNIDNITGEQSTEQKNLEIKEDESSRDVLTDESVASLNIGLSGQFYIDGIKFEYSAEDDDIKQTLYLIKRGTVSNEDNKHTTPRIKDEPSPVADKAAAGENADEGKNNVNEDETIDPKFFELQFTNDLDNLDTYVKREDDNTTINDDKPIQLDEVIVVGKLKALQQNTSLGTT